MENPYANLMPPKKTQKYIKLNGSVQLTAEEVRYLRDLISTLPTVNRIGTNILDKLKGWKP